MWKIKFLSAENLKLVYFLEIVTINLRRKGSQVNFWCKSLDWGLENVETANSHQLFG